MLIYAHLGRTRLLPRSCIAQEIGSGYLHQYTERRPVLRAQELAKAGEHISLRVLLGVLPSCTLCLPSHETGQALVLSCEAT